MKRLYKVFLILAVFVLIGTIKTYATTDGEGASISQDTVAPVFDSNIKTRYVVKRADDGSRFIPENVIKNVKATDNVDGKDVTIYVAYNGVDISQDGQYQVMYAATDKSGNTSYLIITVLVDGMGPVFSENTESLYYINQSGVIFDSKHNVVESLPQNLIATDSVGAYKGIGVLITNDVNGNIIFMDTLKDTPAENVLKINDILVSIDGEDVRGKTIDYAASKIKGEEGTTVQLKIIRNQQELVLTLDRQLIKIYEDEECIAEPNITIDSINKEQNGVIEIIYTATDEAGNTTEFVVKVVILADDDSDLYANSKESEDAAEFYNITTSGTPPEEINIEIPVENTDISSDEIVDTISDTQDVDDNNLE